VPLTHLADYMRHLLANVVAPGGRLIVGAYGSRTHNRPAFDVANFLTEAGLEVAGAVTVGVVPEARFAWSERQSAPSAEVAKTDHLAPGDRGI
jgi:hypothetical protein